MEQKIFALSRGPTDVLVRCFWKLTWDGTQADQTAADIGNSRLKYGIGLIRGGADLDRPFSFVRPAPSIYGLELKISVLTSAYRSTTRWRTYTLAVQWKSAAKRT